MKSLFTRFLNWGFNGSSGGFAQGPSFGPIGNALVGLAGLVVAACVVYVITHIGR